jgi:uncharacterized repeat protein (TIGR01451 family)
MRSWLVVGALVVVALAPAQAFAAATPQRANIVLTKTADEPEVESGASAGYLLTVTNTGRGPGEGIVVRDVLPGPAGLNWVITSGASGCGIGEGVVVCQFAHLRGGESASIHVQTQTTPESCGVLSNTATVTTAEGSSMTVGPVMINIQCKASPTLDTVASPKTGLVGQGFAVFDAVTLSGCAANVCTGNLTFSLVGPNSCSNVALGPASLPVVNNAANAVGITGVMAAGDYYWSVTYSGDFKNNAINPGVGCGDPDELIRVPPLSSPTISSSSSPHEAVVGQIATPTDTVFVSGCYNNFCTGQVTIAIVGPNNCNVVALGPATFQINGNFVSTPSLWTPNAPGNYYWTATYSGDNQNNPVSQPVGCGDNLELLHVGAAAQLSTVASPQVVSAGQQVSVQDTASLSGCFNSTCTGTVTFKLLGPNSCVATALGPITVPVNSNSATATASWTPVSLGDYYWVASYSGDLNNLTALEGCLNNPERVHVSPANKPTPTISTVASPNAGVVGQSMAVFDTITLGGCFNGSCTGSVTVAIVGPNSCSTIALGPGTFSVANNGYSAVGIWAPQAPGDYYWSVSYSGDLDNNPSGPVGCGDSKELIHVPTPPLVVPNLVALALNPPARVGQSVPLQDSATLSGCADGVCTGRLTFTLVGPGGCDAVALGPITVGVEANAATVNIDWTPDAAGDYYWTVSYSGDDNNGTISPAVGCGDPTQLVHVDPAGT